MASAIDATFEAFPYQHVRTAKFFYQRTQLHFGTVRKQHIDGSYEVRYDDGDVEDLTERQIEEGVLLRKKKNKKKGFRYDSLVNPDGTGIPLIACTQCATKIPPPWPYRKCAPCKQYSKDYKKKNQKKEYEKNQIKKKEIKKKINKLKHKWRRQNKKPCKGDYGTCLTPVSVHSANPRCDKCERTRQLCIAYKKKKQDIITKANAFRLAQGEDLRICHHCYKEQDLSNYIPFDKASKKLKDPYTRYCWGCRKQQYEGKHGDNTGEGRCRLLYLSERANACCSVCGIKGDVLEAHHDDPKKKRYNLSRGKWWTRYGGGVEGMKEELKKITWLCRYHHRLHHAKDYGKSKNPVYIARRAIVDACKLKKKKCSRCRRKVRKGNTCCFDWHHEIEANKRFNISRWVSFIWGGVLWKWGNESLHRELETCTLLCANCHKKETDKRLREVLKSRYGI